MKIKHILTTTTLAALSSATIAAPFAVYDARSAGMGGTGVASAQISSAPFYNPAMLAAQRPEEDFSFLAGASIRAQDNNQLIGDLEAFSAAYAIPDPAAALTAISAASGKQLSVQGAGFAAIGVAGDTWSFAVSANSYVQANIGVNIGPLILDSELVFTAVEVEETGISLARKFGNLSIGITPKNQNVTSYDASAAIANNNAITDIIGVSTATTGMVDHGPTTNLDVGLAYRVTRNWKVGAVVRNALTEDYNTNLNKTITLDPQTRVGLGYTGDMITLALDYDLVENNSIVTNGEKTQYLNAGAELDLLDFLQVRAGMSTNIANTGAVDVYSVGVGITVIAAQLDIAVVGNENSVSAYAQLGIRW